MADETEELEIETGADEPQEQHEPDEFVIEGVEEPQDDTPVIRAMRERLKERDRQIAEMRRSQPKQQEIGPEPTLETCDWDEGKFKADWSAWQRRKAEGERHEADARDQEQRNKDRLEQEHRDFLAKAAKLPVKDFDAANAAVNDGLSDIMRQAIYRYMPNPAETVYALGKRPTKLAEIQAETDAVKQLLMLKEVSQGVKLVPKVKSPPPPEGIERGSGPVSTQTADKKLAQLEKRAIETGDRTELRKYRAQMARK